MLSDFLEMNDGQRLQADVCIVGAGPAGITLARKLAEHGHKVCLLESGGADFEQDTQSLYAGAGAGRTYYPLEHSRLRFFGGTTHIWGGRCAPLDETDFERREWVAYSGWPFRADALAGYYRGAHELLRLGRYVYDERLWREIGARKPPFDEKLFRTRFWQFDEREEPFALKHCQDLAGAENVHVVLHANAVHIQAGANARGVEHIRISALDGRQGRVSAAYYILACGGIENPRLLLSARDAETAGIGNGFDQVGRYFMEHPYGRVGRLHGGQAYALWAAMRKRYPAKDFAVAPALLPTAALQREKEILNSAMTFKLQKDPHRGVPAGQKLYRLLKHELAPDRRGRRLYYGYRGLRSWFDRSLRPVGERALAALGITGLSVIVRAEQAPNPHSRVRLSNRKDHPGPAVPGTGLAPVFPGPETRSRRSRTRWQSEFERLGMGVLQQEWLVGGPGPGVACRFDRRQPPYRRLPPYRNDAHER